MKCITCGTVNHDEAKFCRECGTELCEAKTNTIFDVFEDMDFTHQKNSHAIYMILLLIIGFVVFLLGTADTIVPFFIILGIVFLVVSLLLSFKVNEVMVNNAYKDRMKILKNVHVSYHSDEKPRIIDVSVTWKVVLTNKRLLGYDSKGRMIHEIDVVNHIRRYESDGSILRIIPKSGKSITLNVAGNIKTWITAFEELHIGADI